MALTDMVDITMCVGTGCPLRETCYRYMAEPSEYRQSFADFTGKQFGTPTADCPERIPYSGEAIDGDARL